MFNWYRALCRVFQVSLSVSSRGLRAPTPCGRLRSASPLRGAIGCLAILSCALLQGCAALAGDAAYSAAFRIKIEDVSQLSADERRQLLDVKLVTAPAGPDYLSKGKITSIACKLSIAPLIPVWTWRPVLSEANGTTPEEAALIQLKLKAVRAGGDALIASSCIHHSSIDWSNNCFETWMCTGEAALDIGHDKQFGKADAK